jgi:hypothetical protein
MIHKFNNYIKQFESTTNTDIIIGHLYSEDDIKDRLYHFIDMGFNLKLITFNYLDEKKSKVAEIISAVYSCVDICLEKKSKQPYTIAARREYLNNKDVYLTTFDNDLNSEISTICSTFNNCLYNIDVEKDNITIRFAIINEIDRGVISSEKLKEKEKKIRDGISIFLSLNRKRIVDRTTKKFTEEVFKNLVGESFYQSYFGNAKNGYVFLPLNTTKLSKQVLNRNIPVVEEIIKNNKIYIKYLKKSEIRTITEDDLNKVAELYSDRQEDRKKALKDRYFGLQGIFIEFDYDKWYKELMSK